jgi:predicted small metal-binding protein
MTREWRDTGWRYPVCGGALWHELPRSVQKPRHIACSGHHLVRFTSVKRISCVCGLVVEGKDDDELWENAQQHMSADHPDLVGKVARDDIVAQAEETGSTSS